MRKEFKLGKVVVSCEGFDSPDDPYVLQGVEVRMETEKWMEDYNNFRPHESLGGKSPVMLKYGQLPSTQNKSQVDHIPTLKLQ